MVRHVYRFQFHRNENSIIEIKVARNSNSKNKFHCLADFIIQDPLNIIFDMSQSIIKPSFLFCKPQNKEFCKFFNKQYLEFSGIMGKKKLIFIFQLQFLIFFFFHKGLLNILTKFYGFFMFYNYGIILILYIFVFFNKLALSFKKINLIIKEIFI